MFLVKPKSEDGSGTDRDKDRHGGLSLWLRQGNDEAAVGMCGVIRVIRVIRLIRDSDTDGRRGEAARVAGWRGS